MSEDNNIEIKYQSIEKRALDILRQYEGNNNFIIILKNKVLRGETMLGRKVSEYVVKNHDKKVIGINKWYGIDGYLGEELQKKFLSIEKPTKIYVQKLLSDTDKAIHIWGKVWEVWKSMRRHTFLNARILLHLRSVCMPGYCCAY